MEKLKQTLATVDGHNATRLKLTAEIADQSNAVKAYIVKAEDYRILCDFGHCKSMYQQLRRFNEELVADHY